jgi:hypothetical protein
MTICMSADTGSNDMGFDHFESSTRRQSLLRRSSFGKPNTVPLSDGSGDSLIHSLNGVGFSSR